MNTRLLFTHALAPLHPGTGQGVGVIDLPIAREKATGLPYLPGSSLKGALRTACPDTAEAEQQRKLAVFGPDTNAAHDHAGSVQLADQRLLLLPIRSLAGTFAWVTSPYVLHRFAREAKDTGLPPPAPIQTAMAEASCLVGEGRALRVSNDKVYLEDLDLTAQSEPAATDWANWIAEQVFAGDAGWQQFLRERFCVVPDNVLSFLLTTATEVVARIRLAEERKTVASGGLWYEEALPAETILAGLMLIAPTKEAYARYQVDAEQVIDTVRAIIADRTLQLGGKTTVGRGLCRVVMAKGG